VFHSCSTCVPLLFYLCSNRAPLGFTIVPLGFTVFTLLFLYFSLLVKTSRTRVDSCSTLYSTLVLLFIPLFSVHSYFTQFILVLLSSLDLLRSLLFYSVHSCSTQSTLIPLLFYWVHSCSPEFTLVLLSSLLFYSVHSCSTQFKSVLLFYSCFTLVLLVSQSCSTWLLSFSTVVSQVGHTMSNHSKKTHHLQFSSNMFLIHSLVKKTA